MDRANLQMFIHSEIWALDAGSLTPSSFSLPNFLCVLMIYANVSKYLPNDEGSH